MVQPLHFMPAMLAIIPKNKSLMDKISNLDGATQISLLLPSHTSAQTNSGQRVTRGLTSFRYERPMDHPSAQHDTTQYGVVGLIDSGVAVEHPGLSDTPIMVREEPGSEYEQYQQGVRSAHGTGLACIYAETNTRQTRTPILLSGLVSADRCEPKSLLLTMSTIDWMLDRATIKPTLMNYSAGNGPISCADCTDCSGLAKIVDYIVNHEKIMWVKSAGNKGFAQTSYQMPFVSTMTVPADNYNALTVANMITDSRGVQGIRYTSSRGPTLNGRRKPDISAAGHNTRTCAPNPERYPFHFKLSMDFHDGYRLMGGTSAAAAHVGRAIVSLQQSGIHSPMTAKALLLNSADAWVDSGKSGPNDPKHPYQGGHYPVMGSAWNPTYGWGYLNIQRALDQRTHVIEDTLSMNEPVKEYRVLLPVGSKVTLVHERRVGYHKDNAEWALSHVSLELYDEVTQQTITQDDSPIDTVHQVSNCNRPFNESKCSKTDQPIHAIIRVKLRSPHIDGSNEEPFVIVFG